MFTDLCTDRGVVSTDFARHLHANSQPFMHSPGSGTTHMWLGQQYSARKVQAIPVHPVQGKLFPEHSRLGRKTIGGSRGTCHALGQNYCTFNDCTLPRASRPSYHHSDRHTPSPVPCTQPDQLTTCPINLSECQPTSVDWGRICRNRPGTRPQAETTSPCANSVTSSKPCLAMPVPRHRSRALPSPCLVCVHHWEPIPELFRALRLSQGCRKGIVRTCDNSQVETSMKQRA
jgi:hypothetical protein